MYIIECADGSLYTECSHNPESRISQHQRGEGANYTRKRLPVKLVYMEEYPDMEEACRQMNTVKRWPRTRKIALIKSQ